MRNRMLTAALAGVAAIATAAGVTTTAASAAPTPDADRGDVVVKKAATTKAEHDRIVGYWTKARMRSAVPAEVLIADRDKSSATGKVATGAPTKVAPQAKPSPGGSGFAGGYYTGGGEVVETTGKVFFTLGGTNYVCSGSSTSSANKDLVLTAGHCVHEGPGDYATNWAFVPAYDDGQRPFGTFTARALATTSQWAGSGNFDHDVAFAVVNPVNGVDLTDAVGSQGIAFNQPRGQYYYSFGYPQASPYDGSDIAWCHGQAVQDTFGRSTAEGLNCNLTGGSSGGPWLRGYSTSSGLGTLTSVNSFKYRVGSVKNYMWGPYLGSVAQSLYTTASAS